MSNLSEFIRPLTWREFPIENHKHNYKIHILSKFKDGLFAGTMRVTLIRGEQPIIYLFNPAIASRCLLTNDHLYRAARGFALTLNNMLLVCEDFPFVMKFLEDYLFEFKFTIIEDPRERNVIMSLLEWQQYEQYLKSLVDIFLNMRSHEVRQDVLKLSDQLYETPKNQWTHLSENPTNSVLQNAYLTNFVNSYL